MSDTDYFESFQTFYEHQLKSMMKPAFKQCATCSGDRRFIHKPNKLIYTCGSLSGKCGPQITIHLARYMNYPEMKEQVTQLTDRHIDKGQFEGVFTSKEVKEQSEFIKESVSLWKKSRKAFSQQNQLKQRESLIKQTHTRRIQLKKDQNIILGKIKQEEDPDTQQTLMKDYIQLNQQLKEEYETLVGSDRIINPFIIVEEGRVTKNGSTYKLIPKKGPKKQKPKKKEEPKKTEEVEEEAEPAPAPEEPAFEVGDPVEWTEQGKQATGTIDKIVTKNGQDIAEIRTSDGKDITKATSNIKTLKTLY